MRRLLKASVWARDGVPASAWRFRGLFRIVLPLTYLLFAWFGLVAWMDGIAPVRAAAGHGYALWWSVGLTVFSLVALIGVAFPRLWLVETVGLIVAIALIAGYIALSISNLFYQPDASALHALEIILLLFTTWRATDLGRMSRRRP